MPEKKRKRISPAAAVRAAVAPTVGSLGYILWNVEYYKEPTEWILEITIDGEGGISLDDCERVHRAVDPIIDELDPVETSYSLQISSPGIGRELKLPEHFARFLGHKTEVKLFAKNEAAGGKSFTAELTGADFAENTLAFTLADGSVLSIPRREAARVCLAEDMEEIN